MEETYDKFPISDYKISASLKIRALMNVKEISAADYLHYRNRLDGDDLSAIEAVKEIDKLEKKLVNPFCDAYVENFIKIFKENPPYGKSSNSFRTQGLFRVIRHSLPENKHSLNVVFLKTNTDLTPEYAKTIRQQSQNKGTVVVIANTVGLDLNVLKMLESENITFQHRGEHFMTTPRIANYFSASQLAQTIEEMQKIEKDINPKWSDTAKALYISRQMAKYSSDYHHKTISGLFIEKIGDCEAFTPSFEEMMKRQNIPCHICEADRGGHVFNEIYVNKKWVPIDVTWMSGCKNDEELHHLENINFAGEKFVEAYGKDGDYHQDSIAGYMHRDGSINFLSAEELNAARREIIENPKRNNIPKSQSKESVKEI